MNRYGWDEPDMDDVPTPEQMRVALYGRNRDWLGVAAVGAFLLVALAVTVYVVTR